MLSLTACSFYVREKQARNNAVKRINLLAPITDGVSMYNDFMDVFKSFCEQHNEFSSNSYKQKVFKIKEDTLKMEETDLYRYAYVTVSSGSFGIVADIIDTKAKNKLLYKKEASHAEAIDFKVFYVVPKSEKGSVHKGIIIFQNIARYGIKTIFTDYLKEYISRKFNLVVEIGNISPKLYLEHLLSEGHLNKIIYVRNNVSSDTSDGIGYGKEERVISNISNWRAFLEKINNFLNGNNRMCEFDDRLYDGLKIEVKIYNRVRKINLLYIDRLSIIEEIPKTVYNENGSLSYDKLEQHFIIVADEYIENLVFRERQ